MAAQTPGWEGGSLTVLRPDGSEASFSPIYGKGIYAPVGGVGRRQRQHLDFQLHQRVGGHRATVRLPHRELPARHEDRRRDLAARRLCRRRAADAGRRRHRSGRRHLGDQQLAVLPSALGKADEALSTLCGGQGVVVFYRHGEAGAHAADRAAKATVKGGKECLVRKRSEGEGAGM